MCMCIARANSSVHVHVRVHSSSARAWVAFARACAPPCAWVLREDEVPGSMGCMRSLEYRATHACSAQALVQSRLQQQQ